MRGGCLALAFSLLALPARGAEVNVRMADGRIDLSATAAPIAEVLDRLSKQTGMKVVYEGPAPRQLVTVSLHGRTPAEAVLGVLEGQGLNYILIGDASGSKVQTLMMAGSSSVSASRASAPSPPSRVLTPPPPQPDADDQVDDPVEEEEPDPTVQIPNPVPSPSPGVLVPGQTPSPGTEQGPKVPPGFSIPGFPGGIPPNYPASPFTPTPFGPQPGVPPQQVIPSPQPGIPPNGAQPGQEQNPDP